MDLIFWENICSIFDYSSTKFENYCESNDNKLYLKYFCTDIWIAKDWIPFHEMTKWWNLEIVLGRRKNYITKRNEKEEEE